ncbi:hypothetical protein Tco_0409065 [Tanacetum coccineum]
MSTLTFADTHNMVAFLEKPAESDGFHEIIDFLNANQIHYALTVNPINYTSCIEQFWATAKANTVNDAGEGPEVVHCRGLQKIRIEDSTDLVKDKDNDFGQKIRIRTRFWAKDN